MRIFGGAQDTAGCYYRILAPFSVLRYRTAHEFESGLVSAKTAEDFDVLWLHQHADPTTELIMADMQKRGGLVVYDVDDWLFGLPASWPCYDNWFTRGTGTPRERLLFHERLLRRASVITTTTPYLAAKLEGHLGLEPGTVRVLPNGVVMGEWDVLPETAHDELQGPLLGWFGTENHWDDWWDIVPIVDRVLEDLHGHLAIIGAPELITMFPDRLAARTWMHPLVKMRELPKVRRLIKSFDVGLAWTTDRTESSKCRSPLKAIQYGAGGVPVVASETVYGDLWSDCREPESPHITKYGFLAKLDNLEMVLHEALSAARPAALEMAQAWREEIWIHHSYEQQAMRWLDVIVQAHNGKA